MPRSSLYLSKKPPIVSNLVCGGCCAKQKFPYPPSPLISKCTVFLLIKCENFSNKNNSVFVIDKSPSHVAQCHDHMRLGHISPEEVKETDRQKEAIQLPSLLCLLHRKAADFQGEENAYTNSTADAAEFAPATDTSSSTSAYADIDSRRRLSCPISSMNRLLRVLYQTIVG